MSARIYVAAFLLWSAARNGWVEELKFGPGQTIVRLTIRGAHVASRWKSHQGTAEERWQRKIGVSQTDKLRTALEEVVAKMPLEHPHYPASYGAADATITGGNGQDWKAVPRERGNTVSHLPLSALLSEALVAFAMKYEGKSPVALSLSAAVIKGIPPEGRPVYGLGYSAGMSALIRHGFARVGGFNDKEIVYLTRKGLAVSESYEAWIQEVETEWRSEFDNKPVTTLRRALEEVAQHYELCPGWQSRYRKIAFLDGSLLKARYRYHPPKKVIRVDRNSRGGRSLRHAGKLNAEGVRITLLERSRVSNAHAI